MPQYKRQQYSLKQYGKYESTGSKQYYLNKGKFLKSRIRIVLADGREEWIYQHTPIQFKGRYNRLRIRDNTGDMIYSQSVVYKGNAAGRLFSNLTQKENKEIKSQMIVQKNKKQ